MSAKVLEGSYAGLGWGATMVNTEMVIFSANGDSSEVQNYYATTYSTPTAYPTVDGCYTSSNEATSDGYIQFTVTRPLDCGIDNTYVI